MTMAPARHRAWLRSAAGAALAASAAGSARAAEVRIAPFIELQERFTDNVALTSTNRSSDFITTVSPGLGARVQGGRINLDASGQLSRDFYARNSERNGYRENAAGSAQIELIRESVFLDARGFASEQVINQNAAVSATDRTVSGNQTTVRGYTLNPTWRQRFGSWAESDVRYSFGQTFFSQPRGSGAAGGTSPQLPSDATSTSVSAALGSGQEFGRLLWRVSVSESETTRASGDFGSTNAEVATQYALTRSLSALLTMGQDDFSGQTLNRDIEGAYWTTGLQWSPSDRTKVRATFGERYNDETFGADIRYNVSARLTATLEYTDTIGTQQGQFLDNLNFIERNQLGTFVDRRTGIVFTGRSPGAASLTESVVRDKQLTATLRGAYDRDTYSLVVFRTEREPLSSAAGAAGTAGQLSSLQVTTGITFGYGHQITPVLSLGANLNLSRSETEATSATTDRLVVAGSMSYRFNETLFGSLNLNHLTQDTSGTQAAVFGVAAQQGRVEENVISVSVRKSF